MPKTSGSWKKGQSGSPATKNVFKKGEVHNPNHKGNPKSLHLPPEWTWKSLLRDAMNAVGADGVAYKEHVAKALVQKGMDGDVFAIKEIMNRMDGMPQQAVDLTGEITNTFMIYKPRKLQIDEAIEVIGKGGDAQ